MIKEILKNLKIIYEPYCEDCDYRDLEMVTEGYFAGEHQIQYTTIQCKNLKGCRHAREGIETND